MTKHKVMEIEWLCGDEKEAEKICRILIGKKLIACANIQKGIFSLYIWEGKLESGHEVKVNLKTLEHHFSSIEAIIIKEGSYEVPSILGKVVDNYNKAYFDWIVSLVGLC